MAGSSHPWSGLRTGRRDRFDQASVTRTLPPDPAHVSLEPWHAVIALGTDGGQPLADGDELARGVHLLWTLRPELGFPAEGYDVYRRRHRPPEWGCLDPPNGLLPPKGRTQWEFLDTHLAVEGDGVRLDADACPPTGAAHVVGQGSLTVMEPRRRAAVRAVGQGDPPLVEVLADTGEGPQVIAFAPADAREGGGWSAEVWAQGIVGCRLSGEDMRICLVCFGDADETGGWQKLNEPAGPDPRGHAGHRQRPGEPARPRCDPRRGARPPLRVAPARGQGRVIRGLRRRRRTRGGRPARWARRAAAGRGDRHDGCADASHASPWPRSARSR